MDSLTAMWSPQVTEFSSFTVELQLNDKRVEVSQKLPKSEVQFSGLKRGARYTVSVSMVTGELRGLAANASIYTCESPAPPPSSSHSHNNTDSNNAFNPPAWATICCDPVFLLFSMILMILCTSDDCPCSTRPCTLFILTFSMWLCSAPLPPSNLTVVSFDQHTITFTWTPPPDSEEFSYSLNISAAFWGHKHTETVRHENTHTISGLMSGTRYHLELRAVVGGVSSDPVSCSQSTGETHRDHHTVEIHR